MKSLIVLKEALEKFGYKWSIFGGFACYYYKVRTSTPKDLDIIIVDQDNDRRKNLLEYLKEKDFKVKNYGVFFNDVTAALVYDNFDIDLVFTKSGIKSNGVFTCINGIIDSIPLPIYNKVYLCIEKYRTLRDKDLVDSMALIKNMSSSEITMLKTICKKIKNFDYESLENILNFVKK